MFSSMARHFHHFNRVSSIDKENDREGEREKEIEFLKMNPFEAD